MCRLVLLTVLGLLAAPVWGSASAGEKVQKVPIEVFPAAAGIAEFPVEVGVAFPDGALKNAAGLRLTDNAGREVPCQIEPLSCYPGGSLRAALVIFLSPLIKDKGTTYNLEFGEGVSRAAAPPNPASAKDSGGGATVNAGPVSFRVAKGSAALLQDLKLGGRDVSAAGIEQFVQGLDGKDVPATGNAEVTVEEAGPVRACVLVRGRFGDAPDALSHEVRIHAYAGSGLVRLQHTVVGLDEKRPVELKGWGLRLKGVVKDAAFGLGGKAVAAGAAGRLLQNGRMGLPRDEPDLKSKVLIRWYRYTMSCQLGDGEPAEGKADGWASAVVADAPVGVAVRDFWPQFPKEFALGSDGLAVWLHSPRGRPFMGQPGTAKTHDVLLALGPGAKSDAGQMEALNRAFQDGPVARVSPEWTCSTGAFGPLLPRGDSFVKHYDLLADRMLQYIMARSEEIDDRTGATWHMYGDGDLGEAIESCQGNIPNNLLVADSFLAEYLRGGNREWARLAARNARHHMDIDVSHVATLKGPGNWWARSQQVPWVYAGAAATLLKDGKTLQQWQQEREADASPRSCHQASLNKDYRYGPGPKLSALLLYYQSTGDRLAREMIQAHGDRLLEFQKANYGKGAFAPGRLATVDGSVMLHYSYGLSGLVSAYEATGDPRYMAGAAEIVGKLLEAWRIPFDQRPEAAQIKDGKRGFDWLPRHGFWGGQFGDRRLGSNGLGYIAYPLPGLLRFLDLNTAEAKTGLDNGEIRHMFADCAEVQMLAKWRNFFQCSFEGRSALAAAANLGLWSEDTRRRFEEIMLAFLCEKNWNYKGAVVYREPFANWTSPEKIEPLLPLRGPHVDYRPVNSCSFFEGGLENTMSDWPQFLAEFKKYQEKYLKARMDAAGGELKIDVRGQK